MPNLDSETVQGFGEEWSAFDQSELSTDERATIWREYFAVFPWDRLPPQAIGFDLGCGSGRWAACVAPRVGTLHCIDASPEALAVAQRSLAGQTNCVFHVASVDAIPLPDGAADFGYSLGVLHHIPDTQAGIAACAQKLKPGAPFLLYLYYALDNRPAWFRLIWKASDLLRRLVTRLPFRARLWLTTVLAFVVYWPLARTARVLDQRGVSVDGFPLSGYRERSLYTMRTDALDRFGTRLEKRFTRPQVLAMMHAAGFERVQFADTETRWIALGYRSGAESTSAP